MSTEVSIGRGENKMSFFDIKNKEISKAAGDIAMESIQLGKYADKVIEIVKVLRTSAEVVLEGNYDLERVIAEMEQESDALFKMGMKPQEIVELYEKTEKSLINNVATDEEKKENMLYSVLERMQDEFRAEGDIDRAYMIEEDGLEKFMEDHTNKLTGCVTYITDSGIKFFVDEVKLYDDNDIINMHKRDTCFVAGMGLIPTVGTFAGPLAGILDDEQQNNSSMSDNLITNSIGSLIGNYKGKWKWLGDIELGGILGPVFTAGTTGISLNSEDRAVYNEEIFGADSNKYTIPIHKGTGQVAIRCVDSTTKKQVSIYSYLDNDRYLSYERYDT